MTELEHSHSFWNTQPVIQNREIRPDIGPIENAVPVDQVKQTPFPLVKGFSWHLIDLTIKDNIQELYTFLANHYVVHPKSEYAFTYSPEFLDWSLHPPNWQPEWHLCVRSDQTGKMVAFICALPFTLRCEQDVRNIVAVDFLSIHKSLRGKNLAPLLIKEITRRVHLKGIFQAVYTAGKLLTEPLVKVRYYHRLLNYDKLVKIRFTGNTTGQNREQRAKEYKISERAIQIPGFRAMKAEDVPQVTVKLNEYLLKYPFAQVFSSEEVAYNFLPKPGIVGSYVVEKDGEISSFCSFYMVPSSVKNCPEYDSYTAAYLYYCFARTSKIEEIFRASIYMSNVEYQADVFNCLDVFDNADILTPLKFVKGDGHLHYYLFNYAMPKIRRNQCGVVLL